MHTGQWFQLETGWHYNWHRHYDPTTGRYTTPDPLGLHEEPEPGGMEAFDGSRSTALPDVFAVPQPLGPGIPTSPPGNGLRVTRDGPNLYAYAASNPLQQIDPKGLQSRTLPLTADPFSILHIPGRRSRLYDGGGMACIDIEYGHSHREALHWHYWIGTTRKFGGWGLPW